MTEPALTTVLTKADIASLFGLRQLRIGLEYYTAGRIDEAIAAYQKGLAAVGTESHGDESASRGWAKSKRQKPRTLKLRESNL